MKKLFKRGKKPLIIAPSKFKPHHSLYTTDSVVISDPKTISAVERILENYKSVKFINIANEEIIDLLKNKGYEVKEG